MRKVSAHYIFDGYNFYTNKILVFNEKNILIDVLESYDNKEQELLECYNGILCPGFVNAHIHLELSFLKNKIRPKTKLNGFIEQIKRVDRTFDAEKLEQIILADRIMYSEGVSVCADISNSSITSKIKEKSDIYYYTFVELYSPDESEANSIYQNGLKLYENFQNASITPHAPYSVSFSLLQKIIQNTKTNDILSIHFKESSLENEIFYRYQSLPVVNDNPSLKFISCLPLDNKVLFVHNTFITELELDYILKNFSKVFFVVCPNSNLFIEDALFPEFLLKQAFNQMCIGTDSLASNSKLSIIDEIKTLANYYPNVTLDKWLSMATINGAKALNLNHIYGSFDKGKKPGVVLIENVDLFNFSLTNEVFTRRII